MALYWSAFKDVYNVTLVLFELTQHFSREYKFTLGQVQLGTHGKRYLDEQVVFSVHGNGLFASLALRYGIA